MKLAPQGFRVAVVGASSLLGKEVLTVLEERGFPVSRLIKFESDEEEPDAPIVDLNKDFESAMRNEEVREQDVDFTFHPTPRRGDPPGISSNCPLERGRGRAGSGGRRHRGRGEHRRPFRAGGGDARRRYRPHGCEGLRAGRRFGRRPECALPRPQQSSRSDLASRRAWHPIFCLSPSGRHPDQQSRAAPGGGQHHRNRREAARVEVKTRSAPHRE